eukprot:TRINITY_DN2557_c0_g2_i3.p1 TRINITY_DN2557_c0_g2~~TRINITY_DN2557_c0_g2_i3.p1  ORF type:complete len:338 (+),score=58.68 TRINITY_DN2557_c0_g2_i3:109-1122(+)
MENTTSLIKDETLELSKEECQAPTSALVSGSTTEVVITSVSTTPKEQGGELVDKEDSSVGKVLEERVEGPKEKVLTSRGRKRKSFEEIINGRNPTKAASEENFKVQNAQNKKLAPQGKLGQHCHNEREKARVSALKTEVAIRKFGRPKAEHVVTKIPLEEVADGAEVAPLEKKHEGDVFTGFLECLVKFVCRKYISAADLLQSVKSDEDILCVYVIAALLFLSRKKQPFEWDNLLTTTTRIELRKLQQIAKDTGVKIDESKAIRFVYSQMSQIKSFFNAQRREHVAPLVLKVLTVLQGYEVPLITEIFRLEKGCTYFGEIIEDLCKYYFKRIEIVQL